MEKIWFNSYDPGVPETINPDTYTNLIEPFEKFTQQYGRLTAFINFGSKLSYRELDRQSLYLATYLQQGLGLVKGDRFAIMMPNVLQYPVAVFAALRAGLTVVNVNPLYTAPELVHQLNDSGAKAIIVMANFANVLMQAWPHLNMDLAIVTEVGDLMTELKGKALNFFVKYIKHAVPKWRIPGAVTFPKAVSIGKKMQFIRVPIKGSDPAFLQYTGGTTGVAKGAVLTHRNMVANVLQITTWIRGRTKPGEEMFLGALPLYHILSLTVTCLAFLWIGAQCLLVTNPRDLEHLVKTLKKAPITMFVGLNTLFNALLNHPQIKKIKFTHLKMTIAGGMTTKKIIADQWQELTGTPVLEGYGLSEASPVVSMNPLSQTLCNGSVGLPVPGTDVSIRDHNGKEVPLGKEGQLWVKGPQVMLEYWHKPEETKKVLTPDGWLATGDIFRMDNRGFLFMVDREKDMINVSGFNVYPNELEDVISHMKGIREVAVVGVPCEQTGEAVKAFVVKNDDGISENDVIEFCRTSLTGYKVPKYVEFRKELPKSNIGKVLRRQLRE